MKQFTSIHQLFIFIFCFFAPATSYAFPQKVDLTFITEHLPPFQIKENQQVKGYATEIIRKAISHSDLTTAFKIYPWSRAYKIAQERSNTCIYTIARTKQREDLFKWVDVITTTNSHFIGLKSRDDIQIESIDDAKKYKIAVIRDDVTHQLLLEQGFIENKNLYIVNNTYSLLTLLSKRDTIDLILADNLTVKYRAIFNKINPSIFDVYFQLNKKPLEFYLACSKKTNDKYIRTLQSALNLIKDNGEYEEIESMWRKLQQQ